MTIPRIFQPTNLAANAVIQLDLQASHHLARVLRVKINDQVTLFNGLGGEFLGIIQAIDKKTVTVYLKEFIPRECESPLKLHLAQSISRGEKMDYTIQKAVELGVTHFIPLLTERCNVKLDAEKSQKRLQHWQAIIISACEQSGRNRIPEIVLPETLSAWLEKITVTNRLVLSPEVPQKKIALQNTMEAVLLIGPEGGLSQEEMQRVIKKEFIPLNLGPRILRTETAAVAAVTALQSAFGDMKIN